MIYSRIPISRTSTGNEKWFEKSKVASNVAKMLRYCFIRGTHAHFHSIKQKGDGRLVACCVIKIQNELKYNFSGRLSLLQVATVTGISTNWFENFQRFELWRVIFAEFFPTGVENWFKFARDSDNRGFEKLGVKLQCESKA